MTNLASKEANQRPDKRTWVWHNQLNRPVYIVDIVEITNNPVVAAPTLIMDTDENGVNEESSGIFNMVTEWKCLSAITINPTELDY